MFNKKMNSDAWIIEVKNLCFDFLSYLNKLPGGRFIWFQDYLGTPDNPGKIVREYHKSVNLLKKDLFDENASQSLIDHHKIAALYIRAFLKYKPFYVDIPKETKNVEFCLITELPNEYFAIPFLEVIFRGWNDNFEGELALDPTYRDNFIKLLHTWGNNIKELDPKSFSNIIYLIEQHYFH